jgi:hypothetical protein
LEVRKALQSVDTPEIRDLKQLFKQFDVDGDGLISREDLRLAIAKYGYSATEVFPKFISSFLPFIAFFTCKKTQIFSRMRNFLHIHTV